ncbi:gcy-36 [Symbiodinium natans]|uniref:Gcy-36 protein n=1 Tax=Symbiodinium natans TaxID=878477 RepID=A0A812JN35_9DINO|nr:gcy-36 [Symbiodinium natans]
MHGLIHVVFRGFVVDKFGEVAWKEILKRVEDEATLVEMKHYDDALTMAAVKIGAEVAGETWYQSDETSRSEVVVQVLESRLETPPGSRVGVFIGRGTNLHEFLGNLNILHHNVERDLPAAVFPIFEVGDLEWLDDQTYTFRMDYASSRAGLAEAMKGKSDSDQDGTRLEKPKEAEAQEASTAAPAETASAGRTFSFFDFHAALASFWSGAQLPLPADDLLVTVAASPAVEEDWVSTVKEVLATKRAKIDAITQNRPKPTNGQHLYFSLGAQDRIRVGATLFRACSADLVSSPWTDLKELDKTEFFWGAYTKLDNFYAISEDWLVEMEEASSPKFEALLRKVKRGKIRFLSQSWGIPKEWDDLMGKGSYAEAKAAEICCVSKDIAARELGDTSRWKEVYYWVDKCCIPQGDQELTGWCVNLLEEYIIFCDGLVVLVPWTYFTRLWCVYEWVCFLLVHDPMDIEICADPFVRESTLPLFIDAIGSFKLSSCQCFREDVGG